MVAQRAGLTGAMWAGKRVAVRGARWADPSADETAGTRAGMRVLQRAAN